MRTGTLLLVFLLLHVVACRQQEIDTRGQTTSVVAERSKNTVTIGIGPGDSSFSFSAPLSGGTRKLSRVERLTRELDRTVLKVDETSNTEMIRHFIEIYLEKPGFWKEITLTPGDPDKRWEGHEVRLSMEKSEFVEGEPIPVTMNVTTTEPWGAPWWLLKPDRLRVQDLRGRDINLFHRPVSDFDSTVRSKVFVTAKERAVNLTSFVEPYHGIELVNRFGPGTYSVTFHFSYGWPHQDDVIEPGDFAYPRVWGRKKSNTLTFTVRPAEDTRPVDIDALFEKAEQLITESRANDAVRTYKEIVLNTADQQLLEKAIVQILLIRSVASHDKEGFYEEPGEQPDLIITDPAEEEEAKKPLRQRIDEFLTEQKEFVDRCLRRQAFGLSLLHLRESEARKWYREYIRNRAGEFDWETPEGKEVILRWDEARGRDLFHYPMYRALLMEDLRNGDACPRPCAEIYLRLPGEKDAGLLRELLRAP